MNGPAHFREAEKLIAGANELMAEMTEKIESSGLDPAMAVAVVQPALTLAQVHATLALAAAQVEDMESGELRPGWAEIVDEGWDR